MAGEFRIEKDSMGEMRVPKAALYGAQTARAVANFPISGEPLSREMIQALGWIKFAAAAVNQQLSLLPADISKFIQKAAQEVVDGKLDEHFPIDIFQTGSGTSSNMNANEVIANRALQLKGGDLGSKAIHPNDHVNYGQSSNDVFPTAIHVAALVLAEKRMLPALSKLQKSLLSKAKEFDAIVKIGRTHLQDATPIRLGQEFSGYAAQVQWAIEHIEKSCEALRELAQGGTAVGTGINTHADFGSKMAKKLTELTDCKFVETRNHFAAQASQDAAVKVSGALNATAAALIKIANDLRWLGSGPRLGLAELELPAVQPGSSIMPGKVNPVIAESLIMACTQVIANHQAITLGGLYGNFELNVMLPLIARNLHEQLVLLATSADNFCERLLKGLKANRERIDSLNEQSLALATALAPLIGYDKAAEIAKESHKTGKTIRQIAMEWQVLPEKKLKEALDLYRQTKPGIES